MKRRPIHMKENKISEALNNIPIPNELDDVIEKAIIKGQQEALSSPNTSVIPLQKKKTIPVWFRNSAACVAALATCFVGAANLSPTFAKTMENIPGLGSLVKVVSFRQFEYQEETYNASLDTPIIQGLSDSELEQALNAKYLAENKALFEAFEKEVADMKMISDSAHLGLDSGFEIKTNNDQILSIARYVVNTVASSSTTMTYDTIDKQNELVITLPSLFKDDSYIKIISDNIKEQMHARMAADSSLTYWLDDDCGIEPFEEIAADQNFYIDNEGKLVISFDKYTIGPGCIGIQEFTIPTEVLQDVLTSNLYIH